MKYSTFIVASVATVSGVLAVPLGNGKVAGLPYEVASRIQIIDTRAMAGSTVTGMSDVISGKTKCTSVAVIFARGTFDEGNIGVWVGPALGQGLGKIGPVAFEGVDPSAYKADLQGYLADGGSNAGSAALAKTVTAYSRACPDSAIVISGWSQGALVAHKGLGLLDPATQKKVAALVTFGDPWHLFDNTPVPAGVAYKGFCVTGSVFDPLCANLPADFKMPTSANDIIGPFKALPTLAQGAHEVAAAGSLVASFPSQLATAWRAFASTLLHGKIIRLMLSPPHFIYGNNGMAGQAADFIATLPAVKAAASKKPALKTAASGSADSALAPQKHSMISKMTV